VIEPVLAGDRLLADIRQSQPSLGERLAGWWLGQSGFLIQSKHGHLLIDPYLSDSLTLKYANTDKPHVRMTSIPIMPERLDFIDGILSSHNHTDHLDAETIVPIQKASRCPILVGEANREFAAARLQCDLSELMGIDAGESRSIGPFEITAVPAAHEAIEQDEQGRHRYLGFIVRSGLRTLYHSGDTVVYPGQTEWLRPFNIDVAFLPINGRNPQRRVAGNMTGSEAARLAKSAQIGLVIPCHYEMFTFNTESPDAFRNECQEIGQKFLVVRCGERFLL
jgi:L-ascorbate metabolism protein UlaG (beta-lactamase superfamily)